MALNIPMPSIDRSGLFEGLVQGDQAKRQRQQLEQQQQQLQQQQQQFAEQQAIRQSEESRAQQMFPSLMDLNRAKTEYNQAKAAEAQMWANMFGQAPPDAQGVPGMQPIQGMPTEFGQPQQISQAGTLQPPPGAIKEGQSVVLDQGNPSMHGFDKMAGFRGVPQVQTHYENGNLISVYPSGKKIMTRVGMTPQEQAQTKKIGEYQGTGYGKAVDTSLALAEQSSNLNRLVQNLESYPDADNIIGPMNKYMSQFFGNPQDQAFLGDIMATTGNIVLDAAKNIKGAFTGRDQSLINSMKPNATDPYWVFLGKLKGMGELVDMAQRRSDIYADLLHKGVSPHIALKEAQEKTNIEPINDKYNKLLNIAKQRSDLSSGKIPTFSSQEEAQEFLGNLPIDVRLKLLNKVSK